jgi:predicted Mrr-cat superfamily restriction endonuclease
MWMVRAGRGGLYASEFHSKSYVGIGWTALGDPTFIRDKRVLVERSAKIWPDAKEQSRFVGASIVFRFVNEIAVGDMVLTYDLGNPPLPAGHCGRRADLARGRRRRAVNSESGRLDGLCSA